MKLYIVNEQNLYHRCRDGSLDSLFDYIDGTYYCASCNQGSDSLAFFSFEVRRIYSGLLCFTKLPTILPKISHIHYKIVEL